MGIHGLTKVIADYAPKAIQENNIKQYFGRKIAIDASMSIYQFLIAVRGDGGTTLTNESGEVTSHLMGMFYRTIRMVENGIKPLYVFDGKPPILKTKELAKRFIRREEAGKNLEEAQELGNAVDVEKFSRRLVKVTPQHNADCKKLLALMGIPYIDAPGEAEAQCSALVSAGFVYAVGSEDMDTLTFGSPILVRHLTFSEARKMPISEIHLDQVLKGLELTMPQFIDLCILLGCDYCENIKGIGPQKAVKFIQEYGSLEKVLEQLDRTKYQISDEWPIDQVRNLFTNPDIASLDQIKEKIHWTEPDEQGIIDFLVKENAFNEERIRNAVKKLTKSFQTPVQGRLDTFFANIPKVEKHKHEEVEKKVKKKKK